VAVKICYEATICEQSSQQTPARVRRPVSDLLAVSVLTLVVLTRYSRALERVFHENYNSAIYCDGMNHALDQLNARASVDLGRN